jgi:hypothetical protein
VFHRMLDAMAEYSSEIAEREYNGG